MTPLAGPATTAVTLAATASTPITAPMAAPPQAPFDCKGDLIAPWCGLNKIPEIPKQLAAGAVQEIADAFTEAYLNLLRTMTTFWVSMPSPQLAAYPGSAEAAGPVKWLIDQTYWLVGAFAVGGLMVGAGRLAWERRSEPLREIMAGMLRLVVVVFAGISVLSILLATGDEFSSWIVQASFGKVTFEEGLQSSAVFQGFKMGSGLQLLLAFCGAISALIQLSVLVMRSVVIGLLVGMLPIAAAMSISARGNAAYQRILGWLIAFVFYKPVAAVVYAYAFKSLVGPTVLEQLSGILMIILSIVALPALMKLVQPAVAAVGSSSGTGGSVAGAASAATATGARALPARGANGAQPTPGGSAPSGALRTQRGQQEPPPDGDGQQRPGSGPVTGSPRRGGGQPSGVPSGVPVAHGQARTAGMAGVARGSGSAATATAAGTTAFIPLVAGGLAVVNRAGNLMRNMAQDSTGEGPRGSS